MKLTVPIKLLLTLLVSGLIIYIGGSIIRTAIAFELYIPGTQMILKNWISDAMRLQTVRIYAAGAAYTDIAFIVAFISALISIFALRKELKKRGWIFICLVLIILAAPIELYTSYLDMKLNFALWHGVTTFDSWEIKEFFVKRFTKLTIPSALSFLAIATSVILAIWRPLDKTIIKGVKTEVAE